MSFCGRLASRSVLRISGADVHQYLHGLFTNDVLKGLPLQRALYGCFLNTNGRVLFDAFLLDSSAQVDGKPAVLVDVHKSCAADVAEHLLEYRLRRKIKVENLEAEMCVMARTKDADAKEPVQATELYDDPRNMAFGEHQGLERMYVSVLQASRSWNPPEYERLLLESGVGEGPAVFLKEKSLPFEGNIDLLGAVSFDKGCYIGQELTHRTHVMLVTRKRTVPLRLDPASVANGWGAPGAAIFADGVRVGHVQSIFEDRAVGLMRLRYMDKTSLSCQVKLENGSTAVASIPSWWDREVVSKILQQQQES